jgi:hypothetical protein
MEAKTDALEPQVIPPAKAAKPNGKTIEPQPNLTLNEDESLLLKNCNMAAVNAKARIFDLNAELEAAKAVLKESVDTFRGVLAGLARSRDIKDDIGVLADFSALTIIPKQAQNPMMR